MTTLINCRKSELKKLGYENLNHWLTSSSNHIYIGRHNVYVNGTFKSKWCNPFSVKKYGRSNCLIEYEKYIRGNKELMAALHELDGKVLGCWCYPEPCHGSILIKLLNEKN